MSSEKQESVKTTAKDKPTGEMKEENTDIGDNKAGTQSIFNTDSAL